MKVFTVKESPGGKILWEGLESSGGLVLMVPVSPDIGLPTLFIDRAALEESTKNSPELSIHWLEFKCDY